MGAIWFDPGDLADHLHEVVGHKAGLATSLDDLKGLLVDSEHQDALLQSEDFGVRLRAEDYEDLYFTVLYKIGHTESKSGGSFDVLDTYHAIAKRHGQAFATHLMEICASGFDQPIAGSNYSDLDPTSLVNAAVAKLGPAGGLAMLDILDAIDRMVTLSPYNANRFIEWKDTIALDGLFQRTQGPVSHGEFFDQRLIDYLSANMHLLKKIHWRKFEELTAEHFHRDGFKVELGPGQNDDGVDLRIWAPPVADEVQRHLHIVQCKRTAADVDKLVIKGLYADVLHEGANLGVLVTTAELTPGAKATINRRGYPIESVNGEKVGEWLKLLRTPGSGIVR